VVGGVRMDLISLQIEKNENFDSLEMKILTVGKRKF
jgi:hypothetical protein